MFGEFPKLYQTAEHILAYVMHLRVANFEQLEIHLLK